MNANFEKPTLENEFDFNIITRTDFQQNSGMSQYMSMVFYETRQDRWS